MIEKLEKWKDEEGKKVYNFKIESEGFILVTLKKGAVAGEHYHKGEARVKNPELNILTRGKAKYTLVDVNTKEEKIIIAEAPAKVIVEPYTYHVVEALEDLELIEPFDEEAKKDRYELGE